MSLSIAQQSPLNPSAKPSPKAIIPQKGDIAACAAYARELAKSSDVPYMEIIDSVWVRFLNWSFLNDSPRAGRNK